MYSPPTGDPVFALTFRDYFATAVLQVWMAYNATPNDPPSKIAVEAYAMADMYSPPTGGPVFASKNYEGLTLRDYFATAVLQVWMAYNATPNDPPSKIAVEAYAMADEMLKARYKK